MQYTTTQPLVHLKYFSIPVIPRLTSWKAIAWAHSEQQFV